MADKYGKNFEQKFKVDFLKTVPNASLDRIYDTMNGFKAVTNICDFIGYSYPNIFYIECKTHKGASIPFDKISQYNKLLPKVGIPGVRAGIVLWLYEKDVGIIYVPILTVKKLKEDGEKSFGIRHLNNDKYPSIILPSTKKRIFYDTDYSPLLKLEEFW